MKKTIMTCLALLCLTTAANAQSIQSPDGKVTVTLELAEGGKPCYKVNYQGLEVLNNSALGVVTNIGDFTQGLEVKEVAQNKVNRTYDLRNIKQSHIDYEANEAVATYTRQGNPVMDVIFRVSNRDVAFRYKIYPGRRDTRVCVVENEASSFVLPDGSTSFLCPQSRPMGGFARTSPSYETSYTLDEPVGKNGWGEGYTFPCLFRVADSSCAAGGSGVKGDAKDALWLLLSETGTDGGYVGCRLLNEQGGNYYIGFPQSGELNGVGSTTPSMALPGETPW